MRTVIEPDLQNAQDFILRADHLIWVYPVWWGSVPAPMKGFIDQVFLHGYAFKKTGKSSLVGQVSKQQVSPAYLYHGYPSWFTDSVMKVPATQR